MIENKISDFTVIQPPLTSCTRLVPIGCHVGSHRVQGHKIGCNLYKMWCYRQLVSFHITTPLRDFICVYSLRENNDLLSCENHWHTCSRPGTIYNVYVDMIPESRYVHDV